MIKILYIGDKVIIEESATNFIIHYLDKNIVRKHRLDWNELKDCCRDAIKDDTNGKFYDEGYNKIIGDVKIG